jgi:formylglycine-generating enzyme required for sulfatase activity
MDDNGYNCQEFWGLDGWAWRTGKYMSKGSEIWEINIPSKRPVEKRHEPYYWYDEKWNNPLAPVVGITWFEAEAYANWLAKGLGYEVRLPTEYEWERAARGINRREYPWEGPFDRSKANCSAFWCNDDDAGAVYPSAGTSIVGQFKNGNSPEGASDFSGNAREWVHTWWEDEKIHRVVRGGGFEDFRWDILCESRNGYIPDFFSGYTGFRLVSFPNLMDVSDFLIT